MTFVIKGELCKQASSNTEMNNNCFESKQCNTILHQAKIDKYIWQQATTYLFMCYYSQQWPITSVSLNSNSILLSSIFRKRKFWIRKSFRLPVFDRFKILEFSGHDLTVFAYNLSLRLYVWLWYKFHAYLVQETLKYCYEILSLEHFDINWVW